RPSAQRTVPMQVLALGFPRTGTASIKIALETLGYVRTNHGFDAFADREERNMWTQAIRAKFHGEGTPFGREEWDRLLGDCQAISDVPHILFVEELIAAYPEAKVVLTDRSPDSWWKSYQATVLAIQGLSLRDRLKVWLDPHFLGKRVEFSRLVWSTLFQTEHITEEVAKARFAAHNEKVRRLTPRDRLLEFEVKDGWIPLCNFLGKEVPAVEFPRVNHAAQF
ncbi:P-loop containing nucleoside triphosphate hydrolase protein, partial [Mycena epipterygia]